MSDTRQIQQLSPEEVFGFLGSRQEGLSPGEVEERVREVGRNTVEVRDRWKWPRTLARQFSNFFTILLFVSACICFVADRIQPGEGMNVLGWALAGVALLNALFSFIQEYRAERAMQALQQFLPQRVQVVRDGATREILAEELVPGDVLVIGEGDRIPADARLVECQDLVVNNAPLTGEAKPVALTAVVEDARLIESRNIAFAGCSVFKGQAVGVVFATGIRTEFGKLAHLSQVIRRNPSSLERETAHMVRVLTVIAVAMGLAFFTYGVVSGRSLWVNLVFMMGIIAANVPEGLLPTFTLSLAMGSLRMAHKNVLVKGLNAVEALGAVHVICTDKTGTLTCNQLRITSLSSPLDATLSEDPQAQQRLLELALGASSVRRSEKGLSGDPLDVAIALAYQTRQGDLSEVRETLHKGFAFDAGKRRSGGVFTWRGRQVFSVKGAWEALRPLLTHMESGDGGQPVIADEAALNQAEDHMRRLAGAGLRVIAVAWRELPEDTDLTTVSQGQLEQGLILGGFLGIEDPVRPEVPAAVRTCHEAGIEVLMITGDHPDTALAVARKSAIVSEHNDGARILTGDVLEQLTERELMIRLTDGVRIFARTTPEQKMKIVAALQAMDKLVAMTGDGVNDAPALKAADVGIAMGRSGTDVARASAQIILLDDNFASIVAGVAEGRTVFANIKKFTNYVLVSNGPEILPYLIYILLPVPLALTVIQILSIDLGTDIIPSMALGQEAPDPEEMQHGPRRRDQGLLTPALICHSYMFLGLLEALWSLGLFFLVLVQGGWHYGQDLGAADPLYRSATGIALSTILLMQIGNLIGRRFARRSGLDRGLWVNRLLLAGILVQILFSWALLYTAPLQKVLGTGPVSWRMFALAWLGIPLIFGLDYVRKRLLGERAMR
ncbi:cation-translocating P-type ATPase [Syntrophotalea carbinolica DSM 2380]|uniref:Cation-translocating P-type ATPase n=1 Tax=Syntrophotalea carbinolica (strain DSM 2380 / NBRC 103641 / GraBd1) TaxID=338963 RepID=Q3A289_SYNC1|nr:cation-transporting P-type ATPase [Syntrophotalea carbinolica]ABA89518.1 cation-translocating P-type ATPase [Syntrophotalea carbinolica DSM 2380]